MTAEVRTTEEIKPPERPPFLEWVQRNLFSTWYDALLTLVSAALIYLVVSGALRWVLSTADWTPVSKNFLLFLVGQYPRPLLWRVGTSVAGLALLLGLSWGVWGKAAEPFALTTMVFFGFMAVIPIAALSLAVRLYMAAVPLIVYLGFQIGKRDWVSNRALLIGWAIGVTVVYYLLRGSSTIPLVQPVSIDLWGGLLVTSLLAVGGITISFPIGVLLALARRSSLPVLRFFSTAFIELIRGVPLITLLFMGSLLVPLFLPEGMRIDRLFRALVAMTVFSAAYTAENVRGGLQAIPAGQYDAAHAVGLNSVQTTFFIVLPQALRLVIPSIVGQFISLFKDTTLASGVAVLEILTIGRSVLQGNPEYIGLFAEVYLFIAVIFWIFSYSMSAASRAFETRLGIGRT